MGPSHFLSRLLANFTRGKHRVGGSEYVVNSHSIADNSLFNVTQLNLKMPNRIFISLLCLAMTSSLCARQDSSDRQKIHFFEKSIRPLLEEKCITCHGPKKQESGLRLDGLRFLKKGGDSGPAIVQGKPDESLMIQAIEHSSDLQMPPKEKLPRPQIAAIRKWIREGAAWPEVGNVELVQSKWRNHWAFQKIGNPVPPVSVPIDGTRTRIQNPIDQFILQRMANAGLLPSEPADKRTLIRRAYFDLHGLSPNFEQTLKFVDDHRPDAFSNLIDQLLGSTRYVASEATRSNCVRSLDAQREVDVVVVRVHCVPQWSVNLVQLSTDVHQRQFITISDDGELEDNFGV